MTDVLPEFSPEPSTPSTDPSLTPAADADIPGGPAGPESPEPVEFTPEQEELRRFLANIELVRAHPKEAADRLKRFSREIYHIGGGPLGPYVTSKTVRVVMVAENTEGVGSRKRNTFTLEGANKKVMGSDQKRHKQSIKAEIKVTSQYIKSLAETLGDTHIGRLSDVQVELYAAALEYAQSLPGRLRNGGERDNPTGFDGTKNTRFTSLKDVKDVIASSVARFHATEAALRRAEEGRESDDDSAPEPGTDTEPTAPTSPEPGLSGTPTKRIKIIKPAEKPGATESKIKEKAVETDLSREDIESILGEIEKDPAEVLRVLEEIADKENLEHQSILELVSQIKDKWKSVSDMTEAEKTNLVERIDAMNQAHYEKFGGHKTTKDSTEKENSFWLRNEAAAEILSGTLEAIVEKMRYNINDVYRAVDEVLEAQENISDKDSKTLSRLRLITMKLFSLNDLNDVAQANLAKEVKKIVSRAVHK